MMNRRILKGAITGVVLTNIPVAVFQNTDLIESIAVLSFIIGTFIAGYIAGDKVGGAICGIIIDGPLLLFAIIRIQEGSLEGLVFMFIWILLFIPLALLGFMGGYVALHRNKQITMDSGLLHEDISKMDQISKTERETERPKFCPECGNEVSNDVGFCSYCDTIL